jgi:hypothetical protein
VYQSTELADTPAFGIAEIGASRNAKIASLFMKPCQPVNEALPACLASLCHGSSQVLRLSTGFPYKVLSLSTKPEVPWYSVRTCCWSCYPGSLQGGPASGEVNARR